jgi:hypothetical protein
MANKPDLTQESTEAVELFKQMDVLATQSPEVFEFFLSKYGSQMLDFYDWGQLWRVDQQNDGLAKILPWISAAISIITLIVVIIKK